MKMECEELVLELSAYVDSELSEKKRRAVETHLETCRACRQKVSELEEISQILKNTLSTGNEPEIDLTGVWEKIESKINFSPSIWERLIKWVKKPVVWVPVTAAATSFAILLCLLPIQEKQISAGMSRIESVYSKTGQIMTLQTAASGQPIIWILPEAGKEAG